MEENRSIVPAILRGELIRTGPIWLAMIIPNQNPVLLTDTMKPI